MRKLRGGPADGREVKDHVDFPRVFLDRSAADSPIYLTSAIGRSIYDLKDGSYWFIGYVMEEPEEIVEQ